MGHQDWPWDSVDDAKEFEQLLLVHRRFMANPLTKESHQLRSVAINLLREFRRRHASHVSSELDV